MNDCDWDYVNFKALTQITLSEVVGKDLLCCKRSTDYKAIGEIYTVIADDIFSIDGMGYEIVKQKDLARFRSPFLSMYRGSDAIIDQYHCYIPTDRIYNEMAFEAKLSGNWKAVAMYYAEMHNNYLIEKKHVLTKSRRDLRKLFTS